MQAENATFPKAVLWDLDGTLINTEPYWQQGEVEMFKRHGGRMESDFAVKMQGTHLEHVAEQMILRGMNADPEQICREISDYVFQKEKEQLPWNPGILNILEQLRDASIPSILVTASPRCMAENFLSQAPKNAFAGYVCGQDDLPHKPDPAPYMRGADIARFVLGNDSIANSEMLAFEDSEPGIIAATGAGAKTIAITGTSRIDIANDPAYADLKRKTVARIPNLEGYTLQMLADFNIAANRD